MCVVRGVGRGAITTHTRAEARRTRSGTRMARGKHEATCRGFKAGEGGVCRYTMHLAGWLAAGQVVRGEAGGNAMPGARGGRRGRSCRRALLWGGGGGRLVAQHGGSSTAGHTGRHSAVVTGSPRRTSHRSIGPSPPKQRLSGPCPKTSASKSAPGTAPSEPGRPCDGSKKSLNQAAV